MTAQTWAELIVSHFRISPDLHFDGKMLTNAISWNKHFAVTLDVPWTNIPPDHHGIFRRVLVKNGKRVHYYYATTVGKGPSLNKSWTEEINDGDMFLKVKITRSNMLKTTVDTASLNFEKTTTKKRKLMQTDNSVGGLLGRGSENPEDFTLGPSSSPPGECDAEASRWKSESYWTSSEAKKLFRASDTETDALQAINNQMDLLHSVLNDAQGFWHVVTGLESDDDLTAHQKWLINMKAQYLYCALAHAKMMMPLCQNWDKCCQKASDHLLLCGIVVSCRSRCIRNWYFDFVTKNRKFSINPSNKHKLPMFFDLNPNVKDKLQEYCRENLQELSIELISEYIQDTLIPAMVQQNKQYLSERRS